MGGQLTVTSREHRGSTFTFVLPCKVSPKREQSDDPELSDMADQETVSDANIDDIHVGHFHFHPRTMGALFPSDGQMTRIESMSSGNIVCNPFHKLNGLSEGPNPFSSVKSSARQSASLEDACSISDAAGTLSEIENSVKEAIDTDTRSSVGRRQQRHLDVNGLIMNRYHNSNMDSGSTRSGRDSQHGTKRSVEEAIMDEKNTEVKSTVDNQTSLRSSGNFHGEPSHNSEMPKSPSQPKILLVEDNKINVMVTQSMMKQLGHGINVVSNGLEAIRAVQSNTFDLILMVIFSTIRHPPLSSYVDFIEFSWKINCIYSRSNST